MKVTIITCSLNSDQTLEACIKSVINQDYSNIEYIVIDGGSTDSCGSIVGKYRARIAHYVSEADSGIYEAINKGIMAASGDIIGILNSDDYFADTNAISRIVQAFYDNRKAGAVYSDVMFVDKFDVRKKIRHYSSRRFKPSLFKFGFQPAHPTFYAKKQLFTMFGLYRTDFKIAGDFELLLRFILVKGVEVHYVDDLWVNMRVGGISTSGLKNTILLNREVLRACKVNGVYTNSVMIYLKYLVKWWGFVSKR